MAHAGGLHPRRSGSNGCQGMHGCLFDAQWCPAMRPQVCFERNVHGRSRADIEAMATAWEPVPPLLQQLDASALLFPGNKGFC